MKEQIEEIAVTTCSLYRGYLDKKCAGNKECDFYCHHYTRCEKLYKKGYRKQSEGEWIWTESGQEDYEQYWVCSCCHEKDYFEDKFCPNCGTKMKGGA